MKRSSFRNKEMRWLNATPFFPFRDGGNGRNGDLRGTHSIVATVATVAPYSVTATLAVLPPCKSDGYAARHALFCSHISHDVLPATVRHLHSGVW